MTTSRELTRSAVHGGRRVLGAWQARRTDVQGDAPTAVMTALRTATSSRASEEERAWIRRIEATRTLLSLSPEALEIEDFGAGKRDEMDSQEHRTVQMTTRTLGHMTTSSKPPRWAYLLFRLMRELKPEHCIEMGSCVGVSASYQAAALELNGAGRLVTLEGSDVLARRSEKTLSDLGLSERASVRLGPFAETLPSVIREMSPVDWAFVDGHHAEDATVDYMEQLLPAMSTESLIVFDDINWSAGMRRAWQRAQADDRFSLTVDLRSVGLAVVSAERQRTRSVSVAYG